jgi:hypothetical protein
MPDIQHVAEYTGEQKGIQGEEGTPAVQFIKKKTRRGGKKKL